jgi:GTP cyclohydrolase II
MIVRLAEGSLRTRFGTFRQVLYYDGQTESIALVLGEVRGAENVLCRVHSQCLNGHVFNSLECDCREQMEAAQRRIQQAGRGVIVWLDQEGKGNGHLALLASRRLKDEGVPQAEAYVRLGYAADARRFTPAAEILRELGVVSVTLLGDNPDKAEELRQAGITVSGVESAG